MLRLIPGTVFRMFGARYSKIILRYPFFVTLFIFLAPRPGGKWSCLPILPQNSFKNYLSDSAVYSQSFYSPVSFLPGILLSCLGKIRPPSIIRTIFCRFPPVVPSFPGTIPEFLSLLWELSFPERFFRERYSFLSLSLFQSTLPASCILRPK